MDILLQKVENGDHNAYREFYEVNYFRLYQFAFSFVHVRESAEEVVNDVFLKLWIKRTTINTIRNIQVYLYVMVKNTSLNYLRDNNLSVPISIDELCVDHFQLIADPELLITQKELQIQIREAVEQLPARCRLIFKLVKDDGLTYKEVASILDLSVKTIDSQLRIALKKLAAILQPKYV